MPTIKEIDLCLPQTQCTKCSFPCCEDYAKAISLGEADINQCPPGGDITINALANLLQIKSRPLNPEFGIHQPKFIAKINEDECIGCLLCIKACPVDAIIGTNKLMHTVIESECTGCDLCLPPCPMDCIDMIEVKIHPTSGPWVFYSQEDANHTRDKHQNRQARLKLLSQPKLNSNINRKQLILESIERAKTKQFQAKQK